MRDLLLVALGGALGASGRYGVSLVLPWSGTGLPWATLVVNALGGAAMGAVFAHFAGERLMLLFLGVGVLGGFTTFSAFSMEIVRLVTRGETGTALAYALLSLVVSVGAAFAAWVFVRSLV
jgi:CrcB protein